MKLKFTKAWISFLSLPLPLDVYKEVKWNMFVSGSMNCSTMSPLSCMYLLTFQFIWCTMSFYILFYAILLFDMEITISLSYFLCAQVLVTLHQSVIPYLSNPIMLWWVALSFLSVVYACLFLTLNNYSGVFICSDFLTRSYDIGGVVSVMALSSLFILMTQHGLEYPNFYDKLYALLEPSVFMAKHRSKFFQVSDIQSCWRRICFVLKLYVMSQVVPIFRHVEGSATMQ